MRRRIAPSSGQALDATPAVRALRAPTPCPREGGLAAMTGPVLLITRPNGVGTKATVPHPTPVALEVPLRPARDVDGAVPRGPTSEADRLGAIREAAPMAPGASKAPAWEARTAGRLGREVALALAEPLKEERLPPLPIPMGLVRPVVLKAMKEASPRGAPAKDAVTMAPAGPVLIVVPVVPRPALAIALGLGLVDVVGPQVGLSSGAVPAIRLAEAGPKATPPGAVAPAVATPRATA